MANRVLLWCGAVGAPLFVAVFLVEGALRAGYDPRYRPVSALALGDRGWVQAANFVVTGLLMTAFAVGAHRALGAGAGPWLLGVFGVALVASGVFPMDPMRGYPPGTPAGDPAEFSVAHHVHDAAGAVVFLVLAIACFAVAFQVDGGWRWYSLASGAAVFVLLVWFGAAWEADSASAGLVQRALIITGWTWVTALALHLLARVPSDGP